MDNQDKNRKHFNQWIRYSSLGLEMAGAVFISTYLGYKLDAWLENHTPWFTILFLFFGIAGAFYTVYKMFK